MRHNTSAWKWILVVMFVAGCEGGGASERLRVLVTNDDGVGSRGIAAVVDELAHNAALDLFVIAPNSNRSGSGDQFSQTAIEVRSTTTASGFPAKSVSGFPADGALFGILHDLVPLPDLVVSGINEGQNIGELTTISGTVGAGLWAARMNVPAMAFSQGLPASDYSEGARYAGELVERFRTDSDFRRQLQTGPPVGARVLNVNFPTCTAGVTRGVRVVPLGRIIQPVSYELTSDDGEVQVFAPTIEYASVFSSDCTSTLTTAANDLQAFTNGFVSVTPLNADLTAADVDAFSSLAR